MLLGYEYDIIIAPINTEKINNLKNQHKYGFLVAKGATKNSIKKAIESIFGVEVEKVNMINIDGKVKRFKGKVGKKNNIKKAIISVKEGQDISLAKME